MMDSAPTEEFLEALKMKLNVLGTKATPVLSSESVSTVRVSQTTSLDCKESRTRNLEESKRDYNEVDEEKYLNVEANIRPDELVVGCTGSKSETEPESSCSFLTNTIYSAVSEKFLTRRHRSYVKKNKSQQAYQETKNALKINRYFNCRVCKKRFNTKSQLNCHAASHLSYRKTIKKLQQRSEFYQNTKTSLAYSPSQCTLCTKTFQNKAMLNIHMAFNHSSIDQSIRGDTNDAGVYENATAANLDNFGKMLNQDMSVADSLKFFKSFEELVVERLSTKNAAVDLTPMHFQLPFPKRYESCSSVNQNRQSGESGAMYSIYLPMQFEAILNGAI